MSFRWLFALLIASGCANGHANASENSGNAGSPRFLLGRMSDALATREYDGVLVYMHDGRMEMLRVVRTYENGRPTARLTSLSGEPRMVESAPGLNQWMLPDGKVTTLERDSMQYLAAAAIALQQLPDTHYELRTAGDDRVAGFAADIVEARPRDRLRFGFRVWIAQSSGMLLGSSRLRPDGRPLEQMMFTRLRLGEVHPPSAQPLPADAAPAGQIPAAALMPGEIPAIELPDGFALIGAGPGPRAFSRHYLYSDGLASVSLYLDPPRAAAMPAAVVLRRGAIHVLERRGRVHSALVLGDVPAATLEGIAASLQLD